MSKLSKQKLIYIIYLSYMHSIFTPFTLKASGQQGPARPTTQYNSQMSFPVGSLNLWIIHRVEHWS
jgi:hypothetical protein